MSNASRTLKPTEFQGGTSSVDENRVIITGENNFFRLSVKDEDAPSSEASFWRTLFSPAGPGYALYLRTELTDDKWRIYSDNIAMARWLQKTVQGMLSEPTRDPSLPVIDATFTRSGDPRYFWSEQIVSHDTKIILTWSDFGDPILVHSRPNEPPNPRPYGVCTVLVPALDIHMTVNGVQAKGRAWPRDRAGRPFSTGGLGFAESWTEAR
jgi:hypothetical protein